MGSSNKYKLYLVNKVQVTIVNTNDLLLIWYQVFLPKTDHFQAAQFSANPCGVEAKVLDHDISKWVQTLVGLLLSFLD